MSITAIRHIISNSLRCMTLAVMLFQSAPASAKEPLIAQFQLQDNSGQRIDSTQFAGKTVLVSFFTSGCNLCARDFRLMREFYVGNAKRNFVQLGISLDQNRQDFDTYQQLVKLAVPADQRFPVYWRNAPGHKDNFGVIQSQPTHFVINTKGQIVWKREGSFQAEDWDNLWEALGN